MKRKDTKNQLVFLIKTVQNVLLLKINLKKNKNQMKIINLTNYETKLTKYLRQD